MTESGRFGPIEWASAFRPVPGEQVCGDHSIAVEILGSAALFGVIDGLGHGVAAATAAASAADVLNHRAVEPLGDLIGLCHRRLATTRGAAITLARIEFGADTLQWMGVGNVAATLLAKGHSGVETRQQARLAGGIVGYQIPEISPPEKISLRPGCLLVIASDGIAEKLFGRARFHGARRPARRADPARARQGDRRRPGARGASPGPFAVTAAKDFAGTYAAALRTHLKQRSEASLAVGYELGRRALLEQVSVLEIIETHFQLITDVAVKDAAALQFLLQTLVPLDVATRGFLDGTRRYEEQRARAEDLADRDAFRSALVNSLQEGFFVADEQGAVVDINDAFVEITGYGAEGLPYRWPHPWIVDEQTATDQRTRLELTGSISYETPIRHRDGHLVWVAINVNAVIEDGAARGVFVGTIRDITGARASAVRDSAVVHLATAAGVARSVSEVLTVLLGECRTAIDLQRVVAVTWVKGNGDPMVQVAGEPSARTWQELDQSLRDTFTEARHWSPLRLESIAAENNPGKSRGILTMLSGAEDVALWLEHNAPRRTDANDRLLVRALVGHLSLAMQHVQQFETAREASLTLQRAMLPTARPPAGFAARYEPAVEPLEIGGDWYDVLEVDYGHVGIVVGDCVGRGLPAAAAMGQLRSSARALLLTGAEPAPLLEALDAAAELISGAYCATVFVGLLDTETGNLRYSSAGHLPALLAGPGSGAVTLDGATSVPLAVQRGQPRPQAAEPLPFGSTLMLFTDGLVERRDQSIDIGIDAVTAVLTKTLRSSAETIADAVLGELSPANGYDDDVAIVVHRRPPAPLRIGVPATPDRLRDIRGQLSEWLDAAGASDDLAADIVLAGNEAATNSVEHAYRDVDPGTMEVEARVHRGEIEIRVIDFGTWKQPPANPGFRGRGIPLMHAVSQRVDLEHSDRGTTVELGFRLGSQDPDDQRAAENARSDST